MHIPQPLIEQIVKGQCTLLVGDRIPLHIRDGRSLPNVDDLVQSMAAACGYTERDLSLPKVAQYYALKKSPKDLIEFLRSHLAADQAPLLAHQLIAQLPFHIIITTNYDELLEKALYQVAKAYRSVVHNEEIAHLDSERVTLVKLYGTISRPETLVITDDQHRKFFFKLAGISNFVRAEFATKTLLLIGYNLNDPNFERLYEEATYLLDRHRRRAYAVQWQPSDVIVELGRSRDIEILSADPTEFLQHLTVEVNSFLAHFGPSEIKPIQSVVATNLTRPYKALNYYEIEDAAIFFGREDDTGPLLSRIEQYRAAILYGESGTGKTSLLNAGIAPLLAQKGFLSISVRAFADPALAIKAEINRRLVTPIPQFEAHNLRDFLAQATAALEQPVVIFLDQFEEFFIRLSSQFQEAFIAELVTAYHDRDLRVKFVFALRKDYLAEMSEFEAGIPEIFHNKRGLKRLTRQNAKQAIVGPALMFGFEYEPDLVEALLNDLFEEGVNPPHLQIVCNALYDKIGKVQARITLEMYKELGGARKILGSYLDEVLLEFPGQLEAVARVVLTELVTSRDTKSVLSEAELFQRLDAEHINQVKVVGKLVNLRLLRRDERDGIVYYELAHEYLVEEIRSWISEQERELKKAREVLAQELDNARGFGTHVDRERMDLIEKYWHQLDPTREAQVLLLYSATAENHQLAHWLRTIEDPENKATTLIKILGETHKQKGEAVRVRAAQALTTATSERAVESLFEASLNDNSAAVREAAALSLVQAKGQPVIARFCQLVKHGHERERKQAFEALAYILDASDYAAPLPPAEKIQLTGQLLTLRFRKHRLQFASGIRGAALGGAVGGLLLFSIDQYFQNQDAENVLLGSLLAGFFFGVPIGLLLGGFIAAGLSLQLFVSQRTRRIAAIGCAVLGGSVASAIVYSLVFLFDKHGAPILLHSVFVFAFVFASGWAAGLTLAQRITGTHHRLFRFAVAGVIGSVSGLVAAILLEMLICFQGLRAEERAFSNVGVMAAGFLLLGAAIALGFAITEKNDTGQLTMIDGG